MFELVDMRYGSSFQELHNLFLQTVCNFVQVGRFHRFWLTSNGSLRVIVVIPQIASSHPEWSQIFVGNSPLIDLRHIGRRIGYYIKQIEKGFFLKINHFYSIFLKTLKRFQLFRSSLFK